MAQELLRDWPCPGCHRLSHRPCRRPQPRARHGPRRRKLRAAASPCASPAHTIYTGSSWERAQGCRSLCRQHLIRSTPKRRTTRTYSYWEVTILRVSRGHWPTKDGLVRASATGEDLVAGAAGQCQLRLPRWLEPTGLLVRFAALFPPARDCCSCELPLAACARAPHLVLLMVILLCLRLI